MFDSKTKVNDRLADAADLVIDFATLGEYGFEPVETAPSALRMGGRSRRGSTGCRSRSGDCSSRSTGTFMAAVERFSVA
jgi:hypothetical protein